ncbi:MAG: DUF2848 domain-containing protein [Deferrisomatales bacterium]
MDIHLTVERLGGAEPLTFSYTRMVNAGYTGRDQEEVRRHIEELAKKGIPGPDSTPTLYPVVTRGLVTDPSIEVFGHETSGEIEYVLLVEREDRVYVGLGSDHTDRLLEETDIPRSKQICPNVLCSTVWPLAELRDHWDQLVMRSAVVREGREIAYQEGPLAGLLDPGGLLEFVGAKLGSVPDGTVIFSGTLATLTGEFVCGERFAGELEDARLGRRLRLSYEVCPLDYLSVA